MITVTPEITEIEKTIAETQIQDPTPHTGIDPRVMKGANHLDRKYPGWADRIDLDTFKLSNCSECVVGQAFGDFFDHVKNVFDIHTPYLGDTLREAAEYGVTVVDDNAKETWDRLEQDWVTIIKERQTT